MRIILLFLITGKLVAQDSLNFFKPYILSNHPLGVFMSRINHNFSYHPSSKKIAFTLSRGNVWLPFAASYLPNDVSIQKEFEEIIWHYRPAEFERRGITNYRSREIEADGIFSTYFITFKSPLNKKFDVSSNIRFFSLTGGSVPYSLLTSDEFIEWFHSNIAGGEDAFGRKNQPFGEAKFIYKDVNNQEIKLKKNDFLISEFSNSINYYPTWKTGRTHFNFSGLFGGAQLNSSVQIDVGFSGSAIRQFRLKKNRLDWGCSLGVLFPSAFQKAAVIINNVNYLFSLENHLNYVFKGKKEDWIAGLNFHMQSNYHSMEERDFHVIERRELTSHDHMGVSHLTRWLQGWTFIIGRNKGKWSIHWFLREDLWVDNAPDAQTGWGIQRKL